MPEQQPVPRTPETRVTGTEKSTEQAPSSPERVLERPAERQEQQQAAQAQVQSLVVPAAPAVPPAKPESLQRVESVLEEGLGDFYAAMPAEKRAEFKRVGEETASQIDALLRSAKATAKKIFDLISRWLRIIPGVNKYFLEQEAKIKTDKILGDIK